MLRLMGDATGIAVFTAGVIAALGLLNAVVGVTLRDRVYLWYAAAMAAFVVAASTQNAVAFLLYLALLGCFARAFLGSPDIAAVRWRPAAVAYVAVAIVEALYAAIPDTLRAADLYGALAPLATTLFLVVLYVAGITSWRRGNVHARHYALAFAGIVAGQAIGSCGRYGVIPLSDAVRIAPAAGAAWGALVLAVALVDRVRSLSARAESLEHAASHDALTGIANRGAFDARLDDEWRRGARTRGRIAVILIDVDHFKAYNDGRGHPRGDRVLGRVAAAIASVVHRPDDFVARYGGEEFAVILPGCSREDAGRIAEAARGAVRKLGIPHPASDHGAITISAGVASTICRHDVTPAALLGAADRALYAAKNAGRNRVSLSGVVAPPPVPA